MHGEKTIIEDKGPKFKTVGEAGPRHTFGDHPAATVKLNDPAIGMGMALGRATSDHKLDPQHSTSLSNNKCHDNSDCSKATITNNNGCPNPFASRSVAHDNGRSNSGFGGGGNDRSGGGNDRSGGGRDCGNDGGNSGGGSRRGGGSGSRNWS